MHTLLNAWIEFVLLAAAAVAAVAATTALGFLALRLVVGGMARRLGAALRAAPADGAKP